MHAKQRFPLWPSLGRVKTIGKQTKLKKTKSLEPKNRKNIQKKPNKPKQPRFPGSTAKPARISFGDLENLVFLVYFVFCMCFCFFSSRCLFFFSFSFFGFPIVFLVLEAKGSRLSQWSRRGVHEPPGDLRLLRESQGSPWAPLP